MDDTTTAAALLGPLGQPAEALLDIVEVMHRVMDEIPGE
jgi:hypothetical protein